MTEFSRLLKEAAGMPPRPLDMVAIRQRAVRLGWRKRASVWLAAIVGVIGIGTPFATTVLSPGGSGQHVSTVAPPTEGRVPSEELPESIIASEPAENEPLTRPTVGEQTTAPVAVSTTTSAVPPAARSLAAAPAASSCSIDNRSLRGGESKQCRFSAATAGGWNYFNRRRDMHNGVDVMVSVTRNGVTAHYYTETTSTRTGSTATGCADDVIEPGDLVEVVITQRRDQYWTENQSVEEMAREWEGAGAGSQWGCTHRGS